MNYYTSSPKTHLAIFNKIRLMPLISVDIRDGGYSFDLEMDVVDVTLSDGITTIICLGITWEDYTQDELNQLFLQWKKCIKTNISGFFQLS